MDGHIVQGDFLGDPHSCLLTVLPACGLAAFGGLVLAVGPVGSLEVRESLVVHMSGELEENILSFAVSGKAAVAGAAQA